MQLAEILRGELRSDSSPENPRTPFSAIYDWIEAHGSGGTSSGITVSPSTSMRYGIVAACVGRLAENVGRAPCKTLQSGTVSPATSIREYRILKKQPNPEMDAMTFWSTLMAHLALWGNCYAEKQFDGAGRLLALWPRSPDKTKPKRIGGQLSFETTDTTDGSPRQIRRDNMLHVRGLSLNGLEGLSPIAYAREGIALGLITEKNSSQFFGNGSRPGGVIFPKTPITDQKQRNSVKEALETQTRGDNRHRLVVFPVDGEWKQVGMPNDDAQFLETRNFQAREIAAIFNVPAVLLHIDDKAATYASAEQFFLSFVKYTILPWLERFESAINCSLFPDDDYYVKFNVDALLRGDFKTRQEGRQIQRQNGIITRNEWRESEDMDPSQGGDEFWQPANMLGGTARAWFRSIAYRIAGWSDRDAGRVEELCQPLLTHMSRQQISPKLVHLLVAGEVERAEEALFATFEKEAEAS